MTIQLHRVVVHDDVNRTYRHIYHSEYTHATLAMGYFKYSSVILIRWLGGVTNTLLYNSNVIFSKCWNTCTLHNKIVGHLSALNN